MASRSDDDDVEFIMDVCESIETDDTNNAALSEKTGMERAAPSNPAAGPSAEFLKDASELDPDRPQSQEMCRDYGRGDDATDGGSPVYGDDRDGLPSVEETRYRPTAELRAKKGPYIGTAELVKNMREADASGDALSVNLMRLEIRRRTRNMRVLFDKMPPVIHGQLWDAIWAVKSAEWCHPHAVKPPTALMQTLDHYFDVMYGFEPDTRQLNGCVGHGFGWLATKTGRIDYRSRVMNRPTVLVPGCGFGYDVQVMARLYGFNAFGLDISKSAVECFDDFDDDIYDILHDDSAKDGPFDSSPVVTGFWIPEIAKRTRDLGILDGPGEASRILGDFFSDEWLRQTGTEKFDIIVDNHFFSAIHPSQRPLWAARMSDLLARPNGRLVCLESPTYKYKVRDGPFYNTAFWSYQLHLTYPGNTKVMDYEKDVINLSSEAICSSSRRGLAMIARFTTDEYYTRNSDRPPLANEPNWVSIWGPPLGGEEVVSQLPEAPRKNKTTRRKFVDQQPGTRRVRFKLDGDETRQEASLASDCEPREGVNKTELVDALDGTRDCASKRPLEQAPALESAWWEERVRNWAWDDIYSADA